MVHFHVDDDGSAIVFRLRRMADRSDSIIGVWDEIADAIAGHNRRVFASEGFYGRGRKWAPLNPKYAAYRIPGPILQQSRRLMESLTVRPLAIEVFRRTSVEAGTDVPYAKWLHRGTRHMPARPHVIANRVMSREIARIVRDHVTEPA